jgi:hypothetical protein
VRQEQILAATLRQLDVGRPTQAVPMVFFLLFLNIILTHLIHPPFLSVAVVRFPFF